MKTLFLACACCALLACGSKEGAKNVTDPPAAPTVAVTQPARPLRVFVAPFADTDQRGLEYFSLGLTLFATARFEELSLDAGAAKALADKGYALEAIVGPHVLPEGSAKLDEKHPRALDASAIYAAAKRASATYVLTGSYAGPVERWSLTVVLYEVGTDQLVEVARVTDERKIFAYASDPSKPVYPGVQSVTVHAMLGEGIARVFAEAGIVLPDAHVQAFSTPHAPNINAFISLARAYRELLITSSSDAKRDARLRLEDANAHAMRAVNIMPKYQLALRLHAWLLWQTGNPGKAREHYQIVVNQDAKDLRALTALGRVELGTGQYDAARANLEAAVALRPKDPFVHFWLGEAYAKLGRVDDAIARYEMSRTIAPDNLDTRRVLVGLYASGRRYADAASELRVLIEAERENVGAIYLLAACERALGHTAEAFAAYDLGLSRFPENARLRKIRKAAEQGAATFIEGIAATDVIRDRMEESRREFQEAVNDGTWLLTHMKKDACEKGLAGSDAHFAKARGAAHETDGRELQKRTRAIRTLLDDDWGLLLTPDEHALAEDLLLYEQKALRDYREMRTAYQRTFKPMLAAQGCSLDVQENGATTIGEIRSRNDTRVVMMPEPPKRDTSGISPVVPNDAVDNVTFFVENLTSEEIVLVLDGRALKPSVPPYEKGKRLPQFSTPIGEHRLCHVAKDAKPECTGTNIRSFVIDEGLIYRVQTP
ncbi:MAG: tetratricopeptide repeat protein [Patescibacteria group bacterium]|nr:MAG: tetratricopeptide repeat protein [Patescibacteria group bacterium]